VAIWLWLSAHATAHIVCFTCAGSCDLCCEKLGTEGWKLKAASYLCGAEAWAVWRVHARPQGGYNIGTLVQALDNPTLADEAAKQLSHTLLMFDAFYDVEAKAKAGNAAAKRVMESWYVFASASPRCHSGGMTSWSGRPPRITTNADGCMTPSSPSAGRLEAIYIYVMTFTQPCGCHRLSSSQHLLVGPYICPIPGVDGEPSGCTAIGPLCQW
jgi:hypothetical protein